VLVIRRREQERTVESVQRYGPDMERQLLELDGDGRLSLGVSVALAQLQAVEQRIRQLLSDGVEMTTDELREAADSRKAAVVDALAALMGQGDVVREGGGKKGDPFRYRLASTSVPPKILYAVPDPTLGTAERNSEMAPNPLQGNEDFRSRPGVVIDDSVPAPKSSEGVRVGPPAEVAQGWKGETGATSSNGDPQPRAGADDPAIVRLRQLAALNGWTLTLTYEPIDAPPESSPCSH